MERHVVQKIRGLNGVFDSALGGSRFGTSFCCVWKIVARFFVYEA